MMLFHKKFEKIAKLKNDHTIKKYLYPLKIPGLNIVFLCPDRLSSKTDVTSGKVNFRPNIRQNLKKKSGYQELAWLLKQSWSFSTLKTIKSR